MNTRAIPRSRRYPASPVVRLPSFHEGRVAVDVVMVAFSHDELGVRDGELRVQGGAGRALHAVVRP